MQKAEMAEEIQKQVGLTTKREAVEALDSLTYCWPEIHPRPFCVWNVPGQQIDGGARGLLP
jgi:hypothetical protein